MGRLERLFDTKVDPAPSNKERNESGIKELNPHKACYLLPIRLPILRINKKRRKLGPAKRRTAGKVL